MTIKNFSTKLPTIQSPGDLNVARFYVNLTRRISCFIYNGSLKRSVNICATLLLVFTLVAGVPNVKAAPVAAKLQQQSSIRAAFYYPWFPEAWTQLGVFPYANYHPSLGNYDSSDQAILKKHIQAMQYGNIQAGISSWWGQGSKTDGRVPALLQAASGSTFRWALYHEQESLGDPSVSQLTSDLIYIRDRYASDPGFLTMDGRFVVFVYADAADGCGMADRWKQANTVNAYIVLKVFPGYASCTSQPEGWHQYSPAVAADSQGGYSYSISPGFWLYGNTERLGRDLARWNTNIRNMVASGALFQLVTTFNEWGESTVVESATEWSSVSRYGEYLDALHNNGQVVPSPTVAPTATATPTAPVPTATNTSVPTVVNTLVATPTSTSVTSTTTTFTSDADSYVDASAVNTNYGGSTQLRIDNSPIVRDYLRFNVRGLSGVVSKATLRIYASSSSAAGYQVYLVPDTSWGEMSINYTNAPTLGGLAGSFGAFGAGVWTTVDITSFITGNGTVSLAMTALNSTAVSFVSREGGVNAPQLVITTGGGSVVTETAAPSATPTATAISVATAMPTATNTPMPTQVFTATPSATAVPLPTVTSTPISGSDPVLIGAGDISSCSNGGDEATAKLIDNINGTVYTTGDNVYESGTAAQFTDCYGPTWGRFKARTRPSPGNHDYNTSGASGYYAYFGSAAGDPTKGYYSYNLGTWHIVVLNSEISEGAGSIQEQWLRQDLAANPTVCTLAYWHAPLFSSGSSHGSTAGSKALWQALYEYHAEVVVNGHEHNYERFAPQLPSGVADPKGIREFVAGMGGRSHYGFGTILPNSEVRNSDTYGVLKFTLHSNSYDWQFVPEAGMTFTDSGTAQCNP